MESATPLFASWESFYVIVGSLLPRNPETGLFVVGASALLLLFVGIHNAWDAVIYLALRGSQKEG